MNKIDSPDRPPLTENQLAQLEASRNREPDTSDIPEAPAAHWRYSRLLFKPRKEAISLRVDADILAWLRDTSDHYQSRINTILRERMTADLQRAGGR